jgi:hypothetical protein
MSAQPPGAQPPRECLLQWPEPQRGTLLRFPCQKYRWLRPSALVSEAEVAGREWLNLGRSREAAVRTIRRELGGLGSPGVESLHSVGLSLRHGELVLNLVRLNSGRIVYGLFDGTPNTPGVPTL